MHVSTPLGKTTVTNKYVPDYNQVGREELKEDLIVLAIKDYYLMMGMDWL
jgi:hypothetical protein